MQAEKNQSLFAQFICQLKMVFFKAKMSIVLALIGLITLTKAQNSQVNCSFSLSDGIYTCSVFAVTIADDEHANIIIGGDHLSGYTDAHVQTVGIFVSNIPFVVTEFFTRFPNVNRFLASFSGLLRIQSNAFDSATNLVSVEINNNDRFETIHANAFSGALNLANLTLRSNQLETIDENSFTGLSSLGQLFLELNRIRQLPAGVFRPLTSIEVLIFSDNLLESLHGSLLMNNPQLRHLDCQRNQVNSIGRDFLDGVPRLELINTLGNLCVDDVFAISEITTINHVRLAFETCFRNFENDPDNQVRTYILELHGGPVIISHVNGTIIARL